MASPPTATPPLHTALHMAAWTTTKEPPSWIGEFYDMLCVKAQGYNLKGPSPRKLDFFPIGDRPVLHGILVLTSTGRPSSDEPPGCISAELVFGCLVFVGRVVPGRLPSLGGSGRQSLSTVGGGSVLVMVARLPRLAGVASQVTLLRAAPSSMLAMPAVSRPCTRRAAWATSRWSSRSFKLVPVRPRLCWPAVRPLILRT